MLPRITRLALADLPLSLLFPPGIRLRPLSRMLACSHPFCVKRGERSLMSSRDVNATRRCLLDAGRTMEDCSVDSGANEPAALPWWPGGDQPFSPFRSPDASAGVSLSTEGTGGARVAHPAQPLWCRVSGLPTQSLAEA
jgi:hypothetical protein